MFEYFCDHVIPGCTFKDHGDTHEAAREKAIQHLHEGHGMEYIDDDMMERVNAAILFVRR